MSVSESVATTQLTFSGSPQPLYMIGDSHCLIFRDLLFQDHLTQQTFIARSKYCPGLATHNMVDSQGQLNTTLLHALYTELLVLPNGNHLVARHMATTPYAEEFSNAIDQPRVDPPLVFFLGELDVRAIFLKKLDPGSDFHLPAYLQLQHTHLTALPSIENGNIIPFDLVTEFALQLLTPFFIGLEQLKRLGFTQIFVVSLPPQTLDDQEFERNNQYRCPVRLRYKALLLFNHMLESLCHKHGVTFLNVWPQLTVQDLLNPQFYLDGQHLNRQACEVILSALLKHLYNQSSVRSLTSLYQKHLETARQAAQSTHLAINYDWYTQFVSHGWLAIPLPETCRYGMPLDFVHDGINRHARLDWVGEQNESAIAGMLTAQPDETCLAQWFRDLFQSPITTWITSCLLCPFHIVSVRPLRIQAISHLSRQQAPPGVMRLLWPLTPLPVNTLCLQEHTNTLRIPLVHAVSQLYLYDATRFSWNLLSPPTEPLDVLDMVLIPRLVNQPPFIMWAGLNLWPTDPTHFSRDGYLIYPGATA